MTMDQALAFVVFATQKKIGHRQAGEEAVRIGEPRKEPRDCSRQGGDGSQDRTQVPAGQAAAERVAASSTAAHAGRRVCGSMGRAARAAANQPWAGSQNVVRVCTAAVSRPLSGWTAAHLAASGQSVAGDGRAVQGGVFRATAPSRAVECLRFRPYDGPGGYHPEPDLPALAVSLRADLFQLGDGDGLFLREFRKPVRRVSERDLGTGQGSATASDGPDVDGSEQRGESGRVYRSLRSSAALLRNRR